MQLINHIKSFAANLVLKKELKKFHRRKQPQSFDRIKTVGIIYLVPKEADFSLIGDFVKFFQTHNKLVKALGYTNTELTPHYCFPKLTYDYFTKKELNWYGKPNSKFVRDFLKNDYDLMIDLTTQPLFALQYLGYLSPARFKVGQMNERNVSHYDFMLNVPDSINLQDYTQQIIHYIKNINFNND